MKFPKFHTANICTVHIPSFLRGISLNESTHDDNSGFLDDCKNIWEENNVLKTRPALNTNAFRLIVDNNFNDGECYERNVTDITIDIDDDTKTMLSEQIDLDISHIVCVTYFLNSGGSIFKSASIMFSRISDDTFFIPNKINFFKGTPQNGVGIFAIALTVNSENNTEREIRIFELSKNLTQWNQIINPYIPTVLINGRGNKYELAKATNQAFTGTPTRVESLNILNGTFYAYYSTDGRSSAFRLPFAGLADEQIVCRLYYSVQSFVEWKIEKNQTSAVANLYNVEVTMHVNREKGIVNFTVPAGEYEVPLITERNENNLRITASKICDYSNTDIAGAKVFATIDDKILAGYENKIYEANYRNPTYFPTDSTITAGSIDSSVTAFAKFKSEIIVFKKGEMYSIKITDGQKLSTTSLLAETDREFWNTDKLKIRCISHNIGCRTPDSVISRDTRVYWLADDNMIYNLKQSDVITRIFKIPNLNGFSKIFGVVMRSYNLFFVSNTAYVFNTETESLFYWEFPKSIVFSGAYCQKSEPKLLCYNKDDNIAFTADLTAEKDTFLSKISHNLSVSENYVTSLIRTEKLSLGCDNEVKKLDEIVLRLKGEAKIKINDRFSAEIKSDTEDFNSIILRTGICDVSLVSIEITALSRISLGSIDIKYTSLKNQRGD